MESVAGRAVLRPAEAAPELHAGDAIAEPTDVHHARQRAGKVGLQLADCGVEVILLGGPVDVRRAQLGDRVTDHGRGVGDDHIDPAVQVQGDGGWLFIHSRMMTSALRVTVTGPWIARLVPDLASPS
ncbi:hypothetical protein [Micromonospora sp. NPDC005173]|uniref:hypothetical protein n=1 Tax=Micromonospora sp. NPDC005173 TaxID=3157165 RepID=UPI0033BBEC08